MYTSGTSQVFAQTTQLNRYWRGVSCGGCNHVCQLSSLFFQGFAAWQHPENSLNPFTAYITLTTSKALMCFSVISSNLCINQVVIILFIIIKHIYKVQDRLRGHKWAKSRNITNSFLTYTTRLFIFHFYLNRSDTRLNITFTFKVFTFKPLTAILAYLSYYYYLH